jgi:hypothetical protein
MSNTKYMTTINMQDQINLLIQQQTKLIQQQTKTNELLSQQQAMIQVLLARLDRSHLFLKPGKQLTPEENYQETVQSNVQLIRESIEAKSWEMIDSLTGQWSQEYKKEVAKHLTTEEKVVIKKLSELYKIHLKAATEAYNQATENYAQAASDVGYQMPPELVTVEKPSANAIAFEKLPNGYQMPSIKPPLPTVPQNASPQAQTDSPQAGVGQKPKPTYTGWGTPSASVGVIIIDKIGTLADAEESEARESILPAW